MNPVEGKRILILEDEVLLAIEAAETLREIGAVVIGPVHRIEAALSLIDTQKPDAAVLDVNIHGEPSKPVAERLSRARIPFILATGYGKQNGIEGSAAVVDKPYNRQEMQWKIAQLFSQS